METTSTLAPRRAASLHGFGRIERLARLRDADTQRARVEHRVAVTELAGDVDLGRQLDPVLNGVLGHQRGVVARAARHNEHLVDVAQVVGAQAHFVEDQLAARAPAVEQRVGHGFGLLVDLLGHVVLEATLLGRFEVPGDRQLLGLDGVAVGRRDFERTRREDRQLVVRQREDPAGVPNEGGDVGGEERHPVLQPEDERRLAPRRHNGVGLVGGDDRDGERAPQPRQHDTHRLGQAPARRLGQLLPQSGGPAPRCRWPRPWCARRPRARP